VRIVECPKFGYGRELNPCLDCRIYSLRKAAEIMQEEGTRFVVTGEVLGQRPMSQHRAALERIERESGLAGLILRPLSAQWLEPTIPEREGWVDRSKLLAIHGRSRTEQLALAAQEGIETFGCPSGGCLLTDPIIAARMRDLFRYCPDYDMRDVKLATFGRHFRLSSALKAVVGRDAGENARLQRIVPDWPRLELVGVRGPLMVIRGPSWDGDKRSLVRLLRHFAPKATGPSATACWTAGERREFWTFDGQATAEEVDAWRIHPRQG